MPFGVPKKNCFTLFPLAWTWFIATAGWALAIVGLSYLQHDCPNRNNNRIIQLYVSTGGNIIPYQDCTNLYQYQWFHLGFQFIVLLGLFAVLVVGLKHFRLGVIGLLAVVTVLLIDDVNTFLALWRRAKSSTNDETNDWLYHRFLITFIGFMAAATGNLLSIMLLGLQENTQHHDDDYHNRDSAIAGDMPNQGNRFLRGPFRKGTAAKTVTGTTTTTAPYATTV